SHRAGSRGVDGRSLEGNQQIQGAVREVGDQKPEQFPVKSEAGGKCGFGNVGENRGNEIDPSCCAPQSPSAAKGLRKKSDVDVQPLKGRLIRKNLRYR